MNFKKNENMTEISCTEAHISVKNFDFSDACRNFLDDESDEYDEDLIKILSCKTRYQLVRIIVPGAFDTGALRVNSYLAIDIDDLANKTNDELREIIIDEGLM